MEEKHRIRVGGWSGFTKTRELREYDNSVKDITAINVITGEEVLLIERMHWPIICACNGSAKAVKKCLADCLTIQRGAKEGDIETSPLALERLAAMKQCALNGFHNINTPKKNP